MKKKGFALALTLWIVAMMSLASVLYLSYGKKLVEKSRQINEKLKVTLEAESMVEILKFYGATGSFQFNTIKNSFFDKEKFLLSPKIFIDGKAMTFSHVTLKIEDTAGLLDLSDTFSLINFMKYEGKEIKDKKDIIHDSIADWLDTDQFKRLKGAENLFYGGYGYFPRNRNYLTAVEELFLIRGMNEFNRSQQEKISSIVVLSDTKAQNILTMNRDVRERIFNISKTDSNELENLKKEGDIGHFLRFFSSIYKENYSEEDGGAIPSHIIKVKIVSFSNQIKKEIQLLMDFRVKHDKCFRILNYKD